MSIWASVRGGSITALDGHSDAANYRGEGPDTLELDVATATSFHNRIRLAVWSDPDRGAAVEMCALLHPDAAARLRDALSAALAVLDGDGMAS